MFHLAPYVKAFEFNGQFIFGSGSNQKIIQDKNDWCNLVKIASLWKEPATECMVIKKINSIYPEISSEQTETALTFLKDNHLLIKHDIFEEDKSICFRRLSHSSFESCSLNQMYLRLRLFVAPKQYSQFRQSKRKQEFKQSKESKT